MSKRIYLIHAPGNGVTGGVESLHQLGAAINFNGGEAYMCYYPYDNAFSKPDKFSIYEVNEKIFCDTENTIHIFPETLTKLSRKVNKGRCCIFWLSIDNYYYKKDHYSFFERITKFYGSLFTKRLPFFLMKDYIHLLQSEYSRQHLLGKKFEKIFIGDYIHYEDASCNTDKKELRVLYNPAKGFHITKDLIQKNPDLEFIPLAGYSLKELQRIMNSSAIYIDFGNHPGRDRLPREFVLKGGIVITGKRGSASNEIDIPIPQKYKFDTDNADFHQQFQILVKEISKNNEISQREMRNYRNIVLSDPQSHSKNVKNFLSYIDSL